MGDDDHPVVHDMRRFRDEMMKTNRCGRMFIDWYYARGPEIAKRIQSSAFHRALWYIFLIVPAHVCVRALFRCRRLFATERSTTPDSRTPHTK
jgi:hypothetical protein